MQLEPSTDVVLKIGKELVADLDRRGICARLFGGAAIAIKSASAGLEFRRKIKDLDLVIEPSSSKQGIESLRKWGWLVDRRSLMFSDGRRVNLLQPELNIRLDVFRDPIAFNQRIHFGERLHLDDTTLTGSDLLLTKLQILSLTSRDLRDIGLLLESMPIESGINAGIDSDRLVKCCSGDWGLYYSCISNLELLEARNDEIGCASAVENARKLVHMLKASPKTTRWKIRSLFGTRLRWYLEVD